ncbi:hypothetical protein BCR42DRAFT_468751 [Absidia repens]|uniref:Transmembrane protein 198 n=1 Tax=Absidia repens TaxID=90262 RepID=A0A1X2J0M4_9FUNG|nr:hypothetical protein BCR42DRAFT_468751 [Absidia repens]
MSAHLKSYWYNTTITTTATATATASATTAIIAFTTCVLVDGSPKDPQLPPPTGNQEPYGIGIQPHWIILSALCILLAIFFIVFSFQYFIFTMAAVGFVFASSATWVILTLAESKEGYPSASIVYMCGSLGAGAVVAGASMYFWRTTLPFLGGFAGFTLGMYLWMWREDHVIINVYARIFTAIGIGVALAVLTYVVESMVVVLATSFLGGFLLILGLDIILRTGLLQAIRDLFNTNPFRDIVYHVDNKIYGMLSAILAVFLISVILQSYIHRGRRFGVNIVKVLEPPLESGG